MFFINLKKILKGSALIITRPQDIEFPFFDKALEVFAERQISDVDLIKNIEASGLKVSRQIKKIKISLNKNKMINMVENRFMSTFSQFSDQELLIGINEMKEKYKDFSNLVFNDKLIFIKLTQ